MEDKKALEKY